MSVKPHVIIIPGAWHHPSSYENITTALQLAGYKVSGVTLPSVVDNDEDVVEDFTPDVEATRKAIQAAADAGDKVALLGHSYGGVVATEAADGFARHIDRIIYMCAFAPPRGKALFDMIPNARNDWIEPEGKALKATKTDEVFFNDVAPELAEEAKKQIHLHSPATMHSKITYPAWQHISSVYIYCTKDAAINPLDQEAMFSQKGKWESYSPIKLAAGHFPHLAKKDETVAAVRRALGEAV